MISLNGLHLVSECIDLQQVDSTNCLALDTGRAGLLIIAREQTTGRGRKQRSWFSPPDDNIYLTVTLGGIDPRFSLVAGVAVHAALASLVEDTTIRIKWPNDILINGKKVCGILCEARGGITAVGIGINVNQTAWPEELQHTAISLVGATGKAFIRDEVLNPLLAELDRWFAIYRSEGFEPIRAAFLENGLIHGGYARLEDGTRCRMIDLTMDGHLEVEISGTRCHIVSGDILPDPDCT